MGLARRWNKPVTYRSPLSCTFHNTFFLNNDVQTSVCVLADYNVIALSNEFRVSATELSMAWLGIGVAVSLMQRHFIQVVRTFRSSTARAPDTHGLMKDKRGVTRLYVIRDAQYLQCISGSSLELG